MRLGSGKNQLITALVHRGQACENAKHLKQENKVWETGRLQEGLEDDVYSCKCLKILAAVLIPHIVSFRSVKAMC